MAINTRNNFWYLCLALIGLLFASAVTGTAANRWVDLLFSGLTVLLLVVGVRSLHTQRSWQKIVYRLALVLGVLAAVGYIWHTRWVLLGVYVTMLLFFVGSFKVAARQILFEGEIDANKMVGSVALYLLIGLIWTELYLILLLFDPSALAGIEATAWQQLFSRVAYFSFATLTTLGYGDIAPTSRLAEFLAIMEAVTGVFYMAVFVSSLINLRGRRR